MSKESTNPLKDIVQEMRERISEIDSQPASTARAIEKIILRKYIPKLKQIGSESYWKKRCEAAEKLIAIRDKWQMGAESNSPQSLQMRKEIFEALNEWQQLKSSIGEETEGQDELAQDLVMAVKGLSTVGGKIEYVKRNYTLIKK